MHAGGLGAQSLAGVGVLLGAAGGGRKGQPNPAHVALAELERRLGERFFLCTQNVDDLHERAGSGGCCICTASCPRRTAKTIAAARRSKIVQSIAASTRWAAALAADAAPHIVFFGEMRWRWIASRKKSRSNADGGCRHVRFGLSGGQLCPLGALSGARTVYVGLSRR